ncbi:dual specificity protein phosphatase 13A-like isoform X2 [Danio rerio]|uniref:Dual specificity protein phosphatase 13A-like isoform X2 n=1 Tax=Danio rerio TaxID=7955 RepID=A0AC58GZI1_DANRE
MTALRHTHTLRELQNTLYSGRRSGNHVDEVWENLYLGDMSVANDRYILWKLGITHVLNAAHGSTHSLGSAHFYGSSVHYYGVPAEDSPSFNLSVFFQPCADYIQQVLSTPGVVMARTHTRSSSSSSQYLSVRDLERMLDSCKLNLHQIDEVWPNIYIGNVGIAQNRSALQQLGITHILNAAHSKRGSIGDQQYYGSSFVYCGIPADDNTHFDLDVYFKPAADFIHRALHSPDGKVLVHCIMGMSRSSTLVLAYLMLYHDMPLHTAIRRIIRKRAIYPNRNFLALLLDLDLQRKRKHRLCVLL